MLIPCSPQCTLQLTLGSQPSTAAASLGPVGSGLGWLLCESESEACQKLMADLRPFSPPTGVPGGNRDCGLLPLAGSTKQVEPWLSASLAAPGLHPNQCAVHWPITCPKQQMRGLGGFCAHSWGPPSVQALRSRSSRMMPRGELGRGRRPVFPSTGDFRVEHGETM